MNVYIKYKEKVIGVLKNAIEVKEIAKDALCIHYNPHGKYINIVFTGETPIRMTFPMDDILEWRIND